MKKTFSIDDILRPKALKLHPGFVAGTSPSSGDIQGSTAGCQGIQDKQYALSIHYHHNQTAIHSRAGHIPGGSLAGQQNYASVIKEHVHRQEGEPPVHHRDSPFYSFRSYGSEFQSKDRHIYYKGPRSPQSGLRICDRFRWDENAFKAREAVPIQKEPSPHRDEGRESSGRESQDSREEGSPGRSCQPSPDSSISFGSAAEEKERRESVSTPPVTSQNNSHSFIKPHAEHEGTSPHTAQSHVSSPSEAEYLGLPTMPHPTYPAPHHIPPQPLPGVCLPLPQVCHHLFIQDNSSRPEPFRHGTTAEPYLNQYYLFIAKPWLNDI